MRKIHVHRDYIAFNTSLRRLRFELGSLRKERKENERENKSRALIMSHKRVDSLRDPFIKTGCRLGHKQVVPE